MDFVGFCVLLLSVGSFVISGFLIANNHAYGFPFSGLTFIFVGFLLLVAGIFIILITFRHYLKKLNESHFLLSKTISYQYIKTSQIIFFKDKKYWVSDFCGKNTIFNLRGFFFKKSFIVAFVVRAIRYNLISNKLPIAFLGKLSLRGFSSKINFDIIFASRIKKRVVILHKGCSKCRLIPCLIIKSKLPPMFEYRRRIDESVGSIVYQIDEKRYINHLR